MSGNIIEQAKRCFNGFEIGVFFTSADFSNLQEDYYQYFGSADFEVRKYAIAAFTGMLGTWETGFCQVFEPISEWEEEENFSLSKNAFIDLRIIYMHCWSITDK